MTRCTASPPTYCFGTWVQCPCGHARSRYRQRRSSKSRERAQHKSIYATLSASFAAIALFRFCLAMATLNRPKSDREARSFFCVSFFPHAVASNCSWMLVSSSSSRFFLQGQARRMSDGAAAAGKVTAAALRVECRHVDPQFGRFQVAPLSLHQDAG